MIESPPMDLMLTNSALRALTAQPADIRERAGKCIDAVANSIEAHGLSQGEPLPHTDGFVYYQHEGLVLTVMELHGQAGALTLVERGELLPKDLMLEDWRTHPDVVKAIEVIQCTGLSLTCYTALEVLIAVERARVVNDLNKPECEQDDATRDQTEEMLREAAHVLSHLHVKCGPERLGVPDGFSGDDSETDVPAPPEAADAGDGLLQRVRDTFHPRRTKQKAPTSVPQ